ncbi:MAG: hypothetical protein AAF791_12560 [Bacteroidota bacterium]
MGKAILLIVMGAGVLLMMQSYNNQTTERESRKDQNVYEDEVLAREIARSGFNVAMGIAREYPNALDAGARAVDLADSTADNVFSGTARGGFYAVRAQPLSGHELRITATGYYGGEWVTEADGSRRYTGAQFTMWDKYRIKVLEVLQDGLLDVSFLESMAGYCSSVFMDEYRGDELVETRMIFASGHRRDGVRPPVSFYVTAGTQLNFFIGVDKNCSDKYPTNASTCDARRHIIEYEYDASNVGNGGRYDHVHYALDIPTADISKMSESVWGMVEQNPSDRQRWRIGWEDQNRTSWDNPSSNNPANSFWALKRLGYDGNGWTERDDLGYRKLRDYGSRPDYSDQVIDISVTSVASDAQRDSLWYAMKDERDACQISSTSGMPPEPEVLICFDGEERMVPVSTYDAFLSNGATGGTCPEPEPEVLICYNESEQMVPESEVPAYRQLGAIEGECPEPQFEMCFGGNDVMVPQSQIEAYTAQGATMGECPEEEVLVCDNGTERTIFESQLRSYLDNGATAGECPEEDLYNCACSEQQLERGRVGILHRRARDGRETERCVQGHRWESHFLPQGRHLLICEGDDD